MTYQRLGLVSLAGLALVLLQAGTATEALAAACPAITVAKDMGISGKYPQQFELAEFEKLANCKLSFSGNPAAGALNGKIVGNPALPSLADRLPFASFSNSASSIVVRERDDCALDRAGPRRKYHEGRVRTRLSSNPDSYGHRRWRPERALG